MKKKWFAWALAVVALFGAMNLTVSVAAEPGSGQDPLVTVSYLNESFMNAIMTQVDQKIAQRNEQIAQMLNGQTAQGGQTSGQGDTLTFSVVTLTGGQTLYGDIGCEVMLRVGSAVCVSASNPGLIDETDAGILNGGGELVKNHMYMMTIEGRGVKATAETTKVLVRGGYTIG